MEPPVVVDALREMGTEGAIITTLMTVIGGLCTVIVSMYVRANKIYGYRLKERDALNTALNSSTEAIREYTRSMENRSAAISSLADAVKTQASTFDSLKDRIAMQYEFLTREFGRHSQVIESMADANRTMAAMIVENKRHIDLIMTTAEEVRGKLSSLENFRSRK